MSAAKETVLVIGATGNIGTSAVIAALNTGRNVLAIVRNQASAEKLFHNVGTRQGITTVEADILSDQGVQGVVDQAKAGKLPAFQHVYSSAGGAYSLTPLSELTTEDLRQCMIQNFESNFFAYRATIPYLKSLAVPTSFVLCTGSQGDLGVRAAPAMSQGALFSLSNAACRETAATNVRFVELYLNLRVEVDESAEKSGSYKASDFAGTYEEILKREEIRAARVKVMTKEDFIGFKWEKKVDV